MKEITITKANSNQRIDKFVKKYLNDAPLSFIYKLFRIKDVKVNSKRVDAKYVLKEGDFVQIYVSDKQLEDFSKPKAIIPLSSKLNVVYEDENLMIVSKPSGLLIHGDEHEKSLTLTNTVLNYLYQKGEYNPNDKAFTPAPCHRLDRNTSGLVLYAKNFESLQILEDLFKEKKELKKEYLALVCGKIFEGGKIDAPLLKNEQTKIVKVSSISKGAKPALTYYNVVKTFKDSTLVKVNIITGRTHQIRVHFSHIDHPVMGDSKYGNFAANKKFESRFNYKNQFLHAYKLSFFNIEGKLSYMSNKEFSCPLSDKESKILKELEND